MNELEKTQSNQLLLKLRQDLSKGYKVLGNAANQVDIVRVWCHREDSQKSFAIVATSGLRFNNPTSFLEVQSFGPGNNYKISFLLLDEKLQEAKTTLTSGEELYSVTDFANEFMVASPDNELTVKRLAAEGHNPKDLVRF